MEDPEYSGRLFSGGGSHGHCRRVHFVSDSVVSTYEMCVYFQNNPLRVLIVLIIPLQNEDIEAEIKYVFQGAKMVELVKIQVWVTAMPDVPTPYFLIQYNA